jgi:hypothetical protein
MKDALLNLMEDSFDLMVKVCSTINYPKIPLNESHDQISPTGRFATI